MENPEHFFTDLCLLHGTASRTSISELVVSSPGTSDLLRHDKILFLAILSGQLQQAGGRRNLHSTVADIGLCPFRESVMGPPVPADKSVPPIRR